MIVFGSPALVLAPMDGITDAPMRALQGNTGAFSFAVSEFLRVSIEPIPKKVFLRDVPELLSNSRTISGMPIQVQILGGDPERMAISAATAVKAGAAAIDINFGCPAPTVNRNDGGASLLRFPCRVREIVRAVRDAVPAEVPVSAKLRLGWDDINEIDVNATMAQEGGADWITIHARTRIAGYLPPVFWPKVGEINRRLGIPVVVNGDIWSREDFLRCREESSCQHFMIGRGALANPHLAYQIATELGIGQGNAWDGDWASLLREFVFESERFSSQVKSRPLFRIKQWLSLASKFGQFPYFDRLKECRTLEDLIWQLELFQYSELKPEQVRKIS